MSHRRIELESETAIIHGAQACQVNKPDCFIKRRGQEEVRAPQLVWARSREQVPSSSIRRTQEPVHTMTQCQGMTSVFTPRLNTETKLLE